MEEKKKIGKFRKWLITKLGGYTELPKVEKIAVSHFEPPVVLRVREMMSVSGLQFMREDPELVARDTKHRLTEKLVEELEKGDMISYQTNMDYDNLAIQVGATVRVIRPLWESDDITEVYRKWSKTP